MKNIIIVAFIAILPVLAFGQNKSIENFYNKYKSQENVTDINLQGWVLELAASFSDDESEKVLEKISKLRVLVIEEGNLVNGSEYNQLVKEIKNDSFEELMQFKEGNEKVDILLKEKGDKITNLLLIARGNDGFIMLSLEGDLDWKDLKSLKIDVEGAEHLKKLPDDMPRA
ncbi:MAG: hypothetical protein ACI94Y_000007 [Maribacter sp.]|jgi:hypothetical protein